LKSTATSTNEQLRLSQGSSSSARAVGVALAALAMSVGWGVRGDYGHEAGAMIPGALLGLAVCCASGRADWWRRAGVMGLCGAIGWAFGGQMSYGRIIGYTAASSFPDVAYGYGSLFVVGGLWGGVGAGILALGITERRSFLERFVRPLVALWLLWLALDVSGATHALVARWDLNDTDWVAALAALSVAAIWPRFFPRDRPACVLIGARRIPVSDDRGDAHGIGLQVPLPESVKFPGAMGTNSHW